MNKMEMPNLGASKKEQMPSEQEFEKRREAYANLLKKVAFRENYDLDTFESGPVNFVKKFLSKDKDVYPEDIIVAEAYAYNELRDAKEKELKEQGKDEGEITDFIEQMDKEFFDVDLNYYDHSSEGYIDKRLEGMINGHEVKITFKGYNNKCNATVDGKKISDSTASEIIKKYEKFGRSKHEAVQEAVRMQAKRKHDSRQGERDEMKDKGIL